MYHRSAFSRASAARELAQPIMILHLHGASLAREHGAAGSLTSERAIHPVESSRMTFR